MQLKDLKSKTNKSIKKLSSIIHHGQKGKLFKFLFLIFIPIFIVLIIILTINISNIFLFKINTKNKLKNDSSKRTFKLAEEAYEQGYFENSAIYFQSFVDSDVSKVEKIIGYKRLFEIAVMQKKLQKALVYLDNIEDIDKKVYEIYINRIKIYLRLNEYKKAEEEINKNKKRFKHSAEFKEISGVYYLKINDYINALKEFNGIPYKKRDFGIHKKIIHCYLRLEQFKKCIDYIQKIEKKLNIVGDDEVKGEFLILKAVTKIKMGKIEDIYEDLKRAYSLSGKYKDIALKLLLFTGMTLNKSEDIYDYTNNNETFIDTDLFKIIGDYYIYNNDYKNALYFYEYIKKERDLKKDELLVMANLYYMNQDYNESINNMKLAFEKYDYRSALLYKNLSVAYGKIGEYQNQLFFLKEGMQEFPLDIDFYVYLAKIYLDMSEPRIALEYINDAKRIMNTNKDIPYDNRVDALYLHALNISNKNVDENELLNLREKYSKNPDNYFKIIDYYLKQRKFIDAEREIDTVSRLPLDEDQKEILYTYQLIISLYKEDENEYIKFRDNLLKLDLKEDDSKINISMIYILDGEYEKALEILNSFDLQLLKNKLKYKIIYLQAVCYYYKNNFSLAYKSLDRLPDIERANGQIAFLISLINKQYGQEE